MKSIRIDKYLADLQVGTRSQVKQLLKKGLVTVNGATISKPDIKVDPAVDRVFFNGKPLSYEREVYYMLHKPAGVVSATRDNHDQTVLDLIATEDRRDDLFPVGRLDKDTTGLLLLTNDGALSHRLLSPRHHVDKTYLVKTVDKVTADMVEAFQKGLDIGDEKPTLPARLCTQIQDPEGLAKEVARLLKEVCLSEGSCGSEDSCLSENSCDSEEAFLDCWSMVTIQEGRFHQIKRMFHAVGTEVVTLKRLRMGSLNLDDTLLPGTYRALTQKELEQL